MNELGDRQVEEGESLLDHLVNYTDGTRGSVPHCVSKDLLMTETKDHTILADEILNITAAGRDTVRCWLSINYCIGGLLELTRNIQTAGLLTFTIYMLTEHPEILTKLREEILRIVGPTQRPTFDNFRDMKYLRVSIVQFNHFLMNIDHTHTSCSVRLS